MPLTHERNMCLPVEHRLLSSINRRKDATATGILEILTPSIYLATWLVHRNYWEKCEETVLQIKIIEMRVHKLANCLVKL